jgi:hypothetical protein
MKTAVKLVERLLQREEVLAATKPSETNACFTRDILR